jgi:hypothetical protein
MIQIAGGILLAVLILAFLPWILVGLSWVFVGALLLTIFGGVAWLIWIGSQSVEGLATGAIVVGVFLIWLHYEIKARRESKAKSNDTPPR